MMTQTAERAGPRAPDFFLVGAAKSGTTSLFHYLNQHRSIFIPDIKEPHYFSEYYNNEGDASYSRDLDAYLALYAGCPDDAVAGDASTSYLYSETAAQQIHALQPGARIIAILRNPVDRAYSFYWYNRRSFVEDLSFEEALDSENRRMESGAHYRFHYVNSGLYAGQIEKYLTLFGRGAMKIYLFEDLKDADRLMREVFAFLGVHADLLVDTSRRFNPSGEMRSRLLGRFLQRSFPRLRRALPGTARAVKYGLMRWNVSRPPPMTPGTRERLQRAFEDDIIRLESLIGRDLAHWMEPANVS